MRPSTAPSPITTACSGLRELGIKAQPRRLLGTVRGLDLVEMTEPDVCCGFGGTFAVKYGELSNSIVERKADRDRRERRPHAGGRRSRLPHEHGRQAVAARARPTEVRHVAEILAGMTDAPPIGAPARRPSRPMTIHPTSPQFKDNAHRALQRPAAAEGAGPRPLRPSSTSAPRPPPALPEFEALRDSARDIKAHTLKHLDLYLEAYEEKVTRGRRPRAFRPRRRRGPRRRSLDICRARGARTVTKGKSMVSEEIGLNDALEAAGIAPIETDLGEYIVQLRGEVPSPHHRAGRASHARRRSRPISAALHTHLRRRPRPVRAAACC